MEIIFSVITGIIIGVVASFLFFKSKIVVIEDLKPNGDNAVSNAMKLSNELSPYFKEKDGKVYVKIFKL